MINNEGLQLDVQDAIKWEPLLHAAEIGVTVNDGVVTLSGMVDSYAKKMEAEHAAKNVAGVKVVVENITIGFGTGFFKNDNEVAGEVVNAMKWNWEIPDGKIKVKVEDGWVTLEGELQWNYQKDAVQNSIKNLLGVKGLNNNITIKSDAHDQIERIDIKSALGRNSSIDDENIEVSVSGNNVTLSGTVESLYQKDEAGRIAWNAPGVRTVDNELIVEYED